MEISVNFKGIVCPKINIGHLLILMKFQNGMAFLKKKKTFQKMFHQTPLDPTDVQYMNIRQKQTTFNIFFQIIPILFNRTKKIMPYMVHVRK